MSSFRQGSFEADLGHLDEVLAFINGSIAGSFASEERRTDLLVAAEEAFTNIFKHAYERGGAVEVSVRTEPGSITLTMVDKGPPFDPRKVPPPDLEAGPEGREVGGLGVHLMMNLVDEVRYRREEGKNVLTLIMSVEGRNGLENIER